MAWMDWRHRSGAAARVMSCVKLRELFAPRFVVEQQRAKGAIELGVQVLAGGESKEMPRPSIAEHRRFTMVTLTSWAPDALHRIACRGIRSKEDGNRSFEALRSFGDDCDFAAHSHILITSAAHEKAVKRGRPLHRRQYRGSRRSSSWPYPIAGMQYDSPDPAAAPRARSDETH